MCLPRCFPPEPCPPSNVQANITCGQLTATVSWERSDLAVGYVAYFDDQNGSYTSCGATHTHCHVSGLTCGTGYNVWVMALGQQHNSSASTVVSATSGKVILCIDLHILQPSVHTNTCRAIQASRIISKGCCSCCNFSEFDFVFVWALL